MSAKNRTSKLLDKPPSRLRKSVSPTLTLARVAIVPPRERRGDFPDSQWRLHARFHEVMPEQGEACAGIPAHPSAPRAAPDYVNRSAEFGAAFLTNSALRKT